MPYVDGKRVSVTEWQDLYGSLRKLHTGPNGENPASGPDIDPEIGAPVSKPTKAGSNRSKRSAKAAKAAIADAMGVKEDNKVLEDIDVSGLDLTEESV